MHKYDINPSDQRKVKYGLNGVRLNVNFDKIYELCNYNKGAGCYGKVFFVKDTNTCIKILADDSVVQSTGYLTINRKQTQKMLMKIKNLDLKNVYKILDITFIHKWKFSKMQGYVMKYYNDEKSSILFRDYEWFKHQYEQLLHDYTVLGENRIVIQDDHPGNYCVDENIILIDCDNYTFCSPFKLKQTIASNRRRAFTAILMLIDDGYIDYCLKNNIKIRENPFKELRNYQIEELLDILKEYKNPLDYINSYNDNKIKTR